VRDIGASFTVGGGGGRHEAGPRPSTGPGGQYLRLGSAVLAWSCVKERSVAVCDFGTD